jgi:hypothetical protein
MAGLQAQGRWVVSSDLAWEKKGFGGDADGSLLSRTTIK